jgi:hypothetical protein
MAKFGNLNPAVITDDMMYEDIPSISDAMVQAMLDEMRFEDMWNDIPRMAKTNKALQSAMEECIIIYKLSKEYKDGI